MKESAILSRPTPFLPLRCCEDALKRSIRDGKREDEEVEEEKYVLENFFTPLHFYTPPKLSSYPRIMPRSRTSSSRRRSPSRTQRTSRVSPYRHKGTSRVSPSRTRRTSRKVTFRRPSPRPYRSSTKDPDDSSDVKPRSSSTKDPDDSSDVKPRNYMDEAATELNRLFPDGLIVVDYANVDASPEVYQELGIIKEAHQKKQVIHVSNFDQYFRLSSFMKEKKLDRNMIWLVISEPTIKLKRTWTTSPPTADEVREETEEMNVFFGVDVNKWPFVLTQKPYIYVVKYPAAQSGRGASRETREQLSSQGVVIQKGKGGEFKHDFASMDDRFMFKLMTAQSSMHGKEDKTGKYHAILGKNIIVTGDRQLLQ